MSQPEQTVAGLVSRMETTEPVLISIGIEKKRGVEKGLYSAFILKTQGGRVVEKVERQADIKVSALEMMYLEMMEVFVVGAL